MRHYFSDIMKDKQNNKKIFSHLHFLYIPFMFFPYSKFLARLVCTLFTSSLPIFFLNLSNHFFLLPSSSSQQYLGQGSQRCPHCYIHLSEYTSTCPLLLDFPYCRDFSRFFALLFPFSVLPYFMLESPRLRS